MLEQELKALAENRTTALAENKNEPKEQSGFIFCIYIRIYTYIHTYI